MAILNASASFSLGVSLIQWFQSVCYKRNLSNHCCFYLHFQVCGTLSKSAFILPFEAIQAGQQRSLNSKTSKKIFDTAVNSNWRIPSKHTWQRKQQCLLTIQQQMTSRRKGSQHWAAGLEETDNWELPSHSLGSLALLVKELLQNDLNYSTKER